jgi:hypothetical protein
MNLVQIEAISRRDVLRQISAIAVLSSGAVSLRAGQKVHQHIVEETKPAFGRYEPKFFNEHEYGTIKTYVRVAGRISAKIRRRI